MKPLFKIPILLVILVAGCKEEYDLQVQSAEQSVLVVEGVLNTKGPTNIRLTRTFELDDTAHLQPEAAAQLTVESTGGAIFPLYDLSGNGHYFSESLPLHPAEQYKLRIRTSDGTEYESDLISVLQNPPIDSISWQRTTEGVQIYTNTHNPENNTRYYRWEYDETWEIRSRYDSYLKVENDRVDYRDFWERVYICWKYGASSSIHLASSARLQSDIISMNPLLFIPNAAEKLAERYSILVRQYALDERGYAFYQLMKKNTESLGSIFDAQPSEITGNLRATTRPAARVIGYVTAGPVQEKRLFIDKVDIAGSWGYQLFCTEKEVPNHPDSIRLYYPNQYLPYGEKRAGPRVVAYYSSEPSCVDCTLRGGSTQPPSYW